MIKLLDCTLRDGGYINNWHFGKDNIHYTLTELVEANIDIIEVGFITNKGVFDEQYSKFNTFKDVDDLLTNFSRSQFFVGMINYGEYDINDIPSCDKSHLDGLRIVFHKKDVEDALQFSSQVKEKGYKVFIQPMVTIQYTHSELERMIDSVNKIHPYAFYIVDSFGVMKNQDLLDLFNRTNKLLSDDIHLGYHSHNNLQMAFSNSLAILDEYCDRELILDSTTYGMGRGAGNLTTELITSHLNDEHNKNYKISPILKVIDNVLSTIYATNYWGYSLPHFLSSSYGTHPNYATFLVDKKTLTINSISEILNSLPHDRKSSFSKEYAEECYIHYQTRFVNDHDHKQSLKSKLVGKEILIIAPGFSSKQYLSESKIENKDDKQVIFVNFNPTHDDNSFVFFGNQRRLERYTHKKELLLITSNSKHLIKNDMKHYLFNYGSLLNNSDIAKDNSTLMLLKLLIDLGVKKVSIVGFDGLSSDMTKNYVEQKIANLITLEFIEKQNNDISQVIKEYKKYIDIEFLTPTKYKVGE